ncbi:BREX-1 system adenine-specific DNA-methyltransferase PglX [Shewanella sp. YQ_9]|uniref:BREX-1 system adenine-specific DNA-methyltransferase PglX n=1 Tax=Shewanella sp. YQ_9 TaxID=3367231 RepID=UPI00370B4DE9
MNTNNVKKYAPKARKAFIEAMSKQAAKYGITKKKIEPAEQKGDLVLIGDRPFPASIIKPRERLVKRIEQQGFDQVMEHVAYSWFNRLCAIRYMERKGFLDHGRRVLSAADGSAGVSQILEECLDVELPGLDQDKVRELKLDGNKDEELYRELLLAQCHALHQAMPFLFEAVADESELLLPENLTKTDSLIRDLVASVPDEDWDHIEIIGWLYQFYISEKKDQVMGKVVKSEDIPAATQLFTPNWIVQYLVQNSVGRQWLQTYPDSPLREKMPYYIEPAEQTPEVQAELAAIVPKELKPETLSCIDPAVGSGHLLIEAYKVFKAIYEERGYRTRDIPQLILENNLFGLDIDDRAGQLAGFALMMLAREDDRRIFSRNIRLNVLSLQESSNVNLPSLWRSLNLTGEWQSGTSQGLFEEEQQDLSAFAADNRYQLLQKTLERFKQAKTFGSLISVPHEDYQGLKELFTTLCELEGAGDSMQKVAATQLRPYVHQAVLLAQKYDAVIANPPYMGRSYFNSELKKYIDNYYSEVKENIYSVFMERAFGLLSDFGLNAQINMHAWMFISRYDKYREKLLSNYTLLNMLHLGANTFPEINGEVVQNTAFVYSKKPMDGFVSNIFRLVDGDASLKQKTFMSRDNEYRYPYRGFKRIDGFPFVYWAYESVYSAFQIYQPAGEILETREGMATADNERFIRCWYEVDSSRIYDHNKGDKSKWYPYNKGGGERRWFGYLDLLVDWENEGEAVKNNIDKITGRIRSHNYNGVYALKEGFTWSGISSAGFCVRYVPTGYMFDAKGPMGFTDNENLYQIVAFLNSKVTTYLMAMLAPTLDFKLGHVLKIPVSKDVLASQELSRNAERCISIARDDWNSVETSRDFSYSSILYSRGSLKEKVTQYESYYDQLSEELRLLEEENNKFILDAYSLSGCIDYKVERKEVSLIRNPHYMYSVGNEVSSYMTSDVIRDAVSFSVGCMLGRFSLDVRGIAFAGVGSKGIESLKRSGLYNTFPVDDDGIIPLTDQEWFPDDATNRFRDFVKVVWGDEHLHENLEFVAESLCLHAIKPKKSESSMDTIRRYLSTQYYKDHLKTYKKRPIYWLFSSGKQKAFECLVYLHRYNEGTLARMRTEYVIPLTAKMAAYAQKLENDKEASGSAAEVKRLEKEIAQLHKQQAELSEFDEKLRHYADQRISLNLDDGVKVNYGKFGDLLAEVKAITGEAPEALS